MNLIEESSDMDMLAGSVKDTGGVYFVTAFSGLLAPYWDREAVSSSRPSFSASLTIQGGMIVGLTAYSTSAHIARATLEAMCYQTRAVLDVIEDEVKAKLETLKVDGESFAVSRRRKADNRRCDQLGSRYAAPGKCEFCPRSHSP